MPDAATSSERSRQTQVLDVPVVGDDACAWGETDFGPIRDRHGTERRVVNWEGVYIIFRRGLVVAFVSDRFLAGRADFDMTVASAQEPDARLLLASS